MSFNQNHNVQPHNLQQRISLAIVAQQPNLSTSSTNEVTSSLFDPIYNRKAISNVGKLISCVLSVITIFGSLIVRINAPKVECPQSHDLHDHSSTADHNVTEVPPPLTDSPSNLPIVARTLTKSNSQSYSLSETNLPLLECLSWVNNLAIGFMITSVAVIAIVLCLKRKHLLILPDKLLPASFKPPHMKFVELMFSQCNSLAIRIKDKRHGTDRLTIEDKKQLLGMGFDPRYGASTLTVVVQADNSSFSPSRGRNVLTIDPSKPNTHDEKLPLFHRVEICRKLVEYYNGLETKTCRHSLALQGRQGSMNLASLLTSEINTEWPQTLGRDYITFIMPKSKDFNDGELIIATYGAHFLLSIKGSDIIAYRLGNDIDNASQPFQNLQTFTTSSEADKQISGADLFALFRGYAQTEHAALAKQKLENLQNRYDDLCQTVTIGTKSGWESPPQLTSAKTQIPLTKKISIIQNLGNTSRGEEALIADNDALARELAIHLQSVQIIEKVKDGLIRGEQNCIKIAKILENPNLSRQEKPYSKKDTENFFLNAVRWGLVTDDVLRWVNKTYPKSITSETSDLSVLKRARLDIELKTRAALTKFDEEAARLERAVTPSRSESIVTNTPTSVNDSLFSATTANNQITRQLLPADSYGTTPLEIEEQFQKRLVMPNVIILDLRILSKLGSYEYEARDASKLKSALRSKTTGAALTPQENGDSLLERQPGVVDANNIHPPLADADDFE